MSFFVTPLPFSRVSVKQLAISLLLACLLSGCEWIDIIKGNPPPQIADKEKVTCLVANDFYAVHFSAYIKPAGEIKEAQREALLRPYCQELPTPGKVFLSADLIDRDIRTTPIGIRIVELEKIGKGDKAEDFKELSVISEVPAKLYPRGVVEAQADIPRDGYYAMFLAIGGEEALAEDDKLRVPFHVGGNPYGLSTEVIQAMIAGAGFLVLCLIYLGYRFWKKRRAVAEG